MGHLQVVEEGELTVAVEEEEVTLVEEEEGMVVEEVVQQAVPHASNAVRKVTGPGIAHKMDQLGEVEGVIMVQEKEEVMVVVVEVMGVVEEAVQQVVPLALNVVRKVTGPETVRRVHQVAEVEGGLLGGKAPLCMVGGVEGAVPVLEHAISAVNQATSATPVPTRIILVKRYSMTAFLYIVQALLLQCKGSGLAVSVTSVHQTGLVECHMAEQRVHLSAVQGCNCQCEK